MGKKILKNNETILITWADWGGACHVIIGVDTMGHESPEDDVIILADSYDTCDHLNDVYYIIGLDKFYFNWQYNKISYFNILMLKMKNMQLEDSLLYIEKMEIR